VAHTEVGQGRADEHRRGLASEERRQIDIGADGLEEAALVDGALPRTPLLGRRTLRVDVFFGGDGARHGRCG
jgi:hypothetical protein